MDFTRLERYRDIVDDWQAFYEACQAPLPTTLWLNTLRTSRDQVPDILAAEGIELSPLPWYSRGYRAAMGSRPGKTLAYASGAFHIQEEVSMLPVAILQPQPGHRLIDLCAAPGNKTVQAAVEMNGDGLIVGNDINYQRLGMVRRNIERIGLTNVILLHHNGSNLPPSIGTYDRVLADVPCSCEGTTRKNPEVLWHPAEPGSFAGAQIALLQKALRLCAPGGRVVYSTCTYAPEENEAVIDAALKLGEIGEQFRVLPAAVEGFRSLPGVTEWQGASYRSDLRLALRAYPHLNNTGGFFVALLERTRQEDSADEGSA